MYWLQFNSEKLNIRYVLRSCHRIAIYSSVTTRYTDQWLMYSSITAKLRPISLPTRTSVIIATEACQNKYIYYTLKLPVAHVRYSRESQKVWHDVARINAP
jgi:hypothetical protein